jgi:branched-chain amino acid transport system permease protein
VVQFIIAGLVLGGIYAIAATGLVITYQAAGILNFSFGAIAFTVARFYYYLNSQHGWPIAPAALLAILGLGPALGLLLYSMLFRHLHLSPPLIKIMATIGVSVALPSADLVIFGNQDILSAPGLAPQPVRVFHLAGVAITMDQVIVMACVVVLLLAGFLILRRTSIGLQVRAMVDSPAMTSLSGTNPKSISLVVWAVSTTLAGLAGVLVAPIVGLDSDSMTLLMVAAFAAVIAAKLRSTPIAAGVSLAIGAIGAIAQYFLPPASQFTGDVLPSVPFVVAAVFLLWYIVRGGTINESEGIGGALDQAITSKAAQVPLSTRLGASPMNAMSWRPPVVAFVLLCGLPLLLHGFWIALLAQGVAYAIIFLSFSLLTGEGGMIWLCQATFAGAGGMTAALLTADHGVPILASVFIGGLVAVPFGMLIGLLTIRMGDIYVALVTITFGLLAENLVFGREIFYNEGNGVNVNSPQFATSPRVLVYVTLAVFVIIAVFIVNLRRSTTGLGMTAVRSNALSSRVIGISDLKMKLLLAGLAAFVAGVGGGMLALTLGDGLPSNYATLGGVVWLAVLVTQGIRSNFAALIAGLSQTLLAGIALVYLPTAFGNVVPILFGLGAVAMVKFPDGVLTMQARQFRVVLAEVRSTRPALYQKLRVGGLVYLVVFIALVFGFQHQWWIWLATTVVVGHVVAGYLIFKVVRKPKAQSGGDQTPTSLDALRPDREALFPRDPDALTPSR